MYNLILLDTETTGIIKAIPEEKNSDGTIRTPGVPEQTGHITQLAYTPLKYIEEIDYAHVMRKAIISAYYRIPEDVEMEIEAMAVTQITPGFLLNNARETFADSKTEYVKAMIIEYSQDPTAIFVAHNADFDRRVLAQYGIETPRWICTQKVAMNAFDLPNYQLQYLRYKLDEYEEYYDIRFGAHDAGEDVRCLLAVVAMLCQKAQEKSGEGMSKILETMMAITEAPKKIRRMPFGKHRGLEIGKLPRDYCDWLINNSQDMDPDLKYAIMSYNKPESTNNLKLF